MFILQNGDWIYICQRYFEINYDSMFFKGCSSRFILRSAKWWPSLHVWSVAFGRDDVSGGLKVLKGIPCEFTARGHPEKREKVRSVQSFSTWFAIILNPLVRLRLLLLANNINVYTLETNNTRPLKWGFRADPHPREGGGTRAEEAEEPSWWWWWLEE